MRKQGNTAGSRAGANRSPAGRATTAFLLAAGFLLLVAVIVALAILPRALLWLYLGMSVLTFGCYALDKSAARRGNQRMSENSLHALALSGGWPGALYARQLLRHKTSKQPFSAVFWLTVALNIAALGYLVSDYGTWLVEWSGRLLR